MSTDSIKTDSGIPVKRLYSRKIASKNADNEEPGKFPYTRGLYQHVERAADYETIQWIWKC